MLQYTYYLQATLKLFIFLNINKNNIYDFAHIKIFAHSDLWVCVCVFVCVCVCVCMRVMYVCFSTFSLSCIVE